MGQRDLSLQTIYGRTAKGIPPGDLGGWGGEKGQESGEKKAKKEILMPKRERRAGAKPGKGKRTNADPGSKSWWTLVVRIGRKTTGDRHRWTAEGDFDRRATFLASTEGRETRQKGMVFRNREGPPSQRKKMGSVSTTHPRESRHGL